MRLEAVELRRIHLTLVSPLRTSFGVLLERDILLVRSITSVGEGWGECCALPEPVYSSEYVEAAQHVLQHHLLPRLFGRGLAGAHEVGVLLAPIAGHRIAKAAIEMALLDAELKHRGKSLAEHLGATHSTVDSGVSVGIQESIPQLLDLVESYLDQGYRRIKLKIEPGWDVEPVKAVRERFGDILLQVDANSAYTLADAHHLAELDPFDLLLIEQPLPEDRLRDHADLARRIRTPICLDESIVSAQAAVDAISLGACSIVNIKAARVSGYLEARRVHDVCAANGVPVWCGGMLETGLGRAGNVALAALPNFTLPGDISASSRYYQRDLTNPFVLEDGRIRVPTAPGLGVHPDEDMLREVTTSVAMVTPRTLATALPAD